VNRQQRRSAAKHDRASGSAHSRFAEDGLRHHQAGRLDQAGTSYLNALAVQPNHPEVLHLLGILRSRQGSSLEAVELITKAIAIKPDFAEAHSNLGVTLRYLQRYEEALISYDKAITLKPDYAEAHNNRGVGLQDLKRLDEAVASYDKAIALRPDYAEAHYNRGNGLQQLKRHGEAIASYDKAITLKPDYAEAYNNRGTALQELNRPAEAVASYDAAIALKPAYAEAHYNRGYNLQDLNRHEDAVASYDKAIALKPGYAEAYYNRGNGLQQLKRHEEAVVSYAKAIALRPDYAEAHNNLGNALQYLKRDEEAVASYDKAIALKPNYAEAYNNRGNALQHLECSEEAVASCDKAIALKPDYAEAHYNRGNALLDLKRPEEAVASYDRVLSIEPDHRYSLSGILDVAQRICDWPRAARLSESLKECVMDKAQIITPFVLLGNCDDPWLHLQCARKYIRNKVTTQPRPFWDGTVWRHERIRIAYLSADFWEHATAFLIAGLLESHDRSRFEVIGVSFGRDDHGDMRTRLVGAFDQFHEVGSETDLEVAKLLHELEIDIAIDLKGYTRDARPEILAHRPAPIQVSYLGYPGTMGAEFIDYVIADQIVLPFDQQPFYTERIVHLPECYQVNDCSRRTSEHTPTRREVGLPDQGFVFCCFNANYKITAPVFDVWMRLLGAVEDSVLWLLGDSAPAKQNLRREAIARGVNPARLVFADRRPAEEHLARHRLADLFLDTLPVNAHTTASDALWAGLPILTCRGEAFAGRVAASLLDAVGLAQLVTDSLQSYEALALRLATDAALLGRLRGKLAKNRLSYPLFDTDRFRCHIEFAYVKMWELWQRGERPRSFGVEPIAYRRDRSDLRDT
jgi:predicted O-linked N-acetylglucosamine transferase (SPINDLY family)